MRSAEVASPPQSGSDHGEPEEQPIVPVKKKGSKAQGRKRTKSGCLTCRKRRIKCGEEKPTCQNCTKSKRMCEGYNQRVIFKDPLNAYRPSLSNSTQIAFTGPMPMTANADLYNQSTSGQNPLPIAPKPFVAVNTGHSSSSTASSQVPLVSMDRQVYAFSENIVPTSDTVNHSRVPEPRSSHIPQGNSQQHQFMPPVRTELKGAAPLTPPSTNSTESPDEKIPKIQPFVHTHFPQHNAPEPALHHQSYPSTLPWNNEPQTPLSSLTPIGPPFSAGAEDVPMPYSTRNSNFEQLKFYQDAQWVPGSGQGHVEQYMEDEEDPFDVSDDDIDMEDYGDTRQWYDQNNSKTPKNLGVLVALQRSQGNSAVGLRSFKSYIDGTETLTSYIPSSQSTPLRDQITARIFCHFINVSGPAISMYERHPANPTLIFQGSPVPKSQQHIWAYKFPTLALTNPALLHAMLAVASLGIAKLQNGPITASLKHYAIGLRRVSKNVSNSNRRKDPSTLAAAMLLAFYEVWSADHQKWSNHLLGAKHLVREVDFAGMTRYIRRRRRHLREAQIQDAHPGFQDMNHFLVDVDEVDENIVGLLMGRKVRYDQYGRIFDDGEFEEIKHYTEKDLETYETQRDLFWWYCKQDVYQSILGGGKLFLDYSLWSHCPPRSPIGRLNATYGTYDHLMLLMGRMATFSFRDLKRKRLAMKASGGHWTPPPHMRGPPPGSQAGPPGQAPQTPQMPGFTGMVPGVREAELPMGWEPSRQASPQSTSSEEIDLQEQTLDAEQEWQDISNALAILQGYFGEDFQALGPEFSTPIETPYGPALQYRTYGIAGIWMNYHMAQIFLQRSHPSMPPAAMMAAGIAARQTAFHANEIGRIAAGIAPDCTTASSVNPSVGAALIESSTCLFLAGVQYQSPPQRHWCVVRLRTIARLTGWQTAHAIATGCETSWIKAAQMGRGPVYERKEDVGVWKTPDVWGNERRIDRARREGGGEGGAEEGVRMVGNKRMVIERTDRVHYALGILGMSEDFEGLDVNGE